MNLCNHAKHIMSIRIITIIIVIWNPSPDISPPYPLPHRKTLWHPVVQLDPLHALDFLSRSPLSLLHQAPILWCNGSI